MDLKFTAQLIKNVSINTNKLLEVLVQATNDTDDVFRLLAYITDYTEPKIKNTSERYKGAELISYNIVTDEVKFKYITERELKVDASRLEDKVYKNYYEIPRDHARGIIKTVEYYTTSSCYRNEWNEWND